MRNSVKVGRNASQVKQYLWHHNNRIAHYSEVRLGCLQIHK